MEDEEEVAGYLQCVCRVMWSGGMKYKVLVRE